MPKEVYNKEELQFEMSYIDPFNNRQVQVQLTHRDVKECTRNNVITKMGTFYAIKHLEKNDRKSKVAKEYSLKYGVICKSTALVGVVKDSKASSTELIPFKLSTVPSKPKFK